MRILFDSHALLWWMSEPARLKASALEAISDPTNLVYASAVSIWELGLKVSKGKLRLPEGFHATLELHGISHLPFTAEHAVCSTALPMIHGDPFDRGLIAQCRLESMTLATRDGMLAGYGVALLEV